MRKATDYWTYQVIDGSVHLMQVKERQAKKLRAKGAQFFRRQNLDEHLARKFYIHELTPEQLAMIQDDRYRAPARKQYDGTILVVMPDSDACAQ